MSEPEVMQPPGDSASPYLLQHADNPVAWQPWDAEAPSPGRAQRPPDSAVGGLLGLSLVPRHGPRVVRGCGHRGGDERPLREHQGGPGRAPRSGPGLPACPPAAQPAGGRLAAHRLSRPRNPAAVLQRHLLPAPPRHGLPAFTDVLVRIAEVFASRRDDLRPRAAPGRPVRRPRCGAGCPARWPPGRCWHAARTALGARYDGAAGGFGGAPKFPMPATLEALLRHWSRSRHSGDADRQALDMVMTTLTRMARGGMFDHLGGGFCRYATDRRWMMPHFEKMLYDNGLLLGLYSDALGSARIRCSSTWWTRRRSGCCATCAPGRRLLRGHGRRLRGRRGALLLWRRATRSKRLLDPTSIWSSKPCTGSTAPPTSKAAGSCTATDAWRAVVERLSLPPEQAARCWTSARGKLLTAGIPPCGRPLDDKILAGWNGLAMAGLAGRGAPRARRLADAASRAADFLRGTCGWFRKGACTPWRNGRLGHRAFLDDHAHLLDALVTLLSARWRDSDVEFARRLADDLLEHFEDPTRRLLLHRPRSGTLIHRPSRCRTTPPRRATRWRCEPWAAWASCSASERYLDAQNRTIDWGLARIHAHIPRRSAACSPPRRPPRPPASRFCCAGPPTSWPWLRRRSRRLPSRPRRLRRALRRRQRDPRPSAQIGECGIAQPRGGLSLRGHPLLGAHRLPGRVAHGAGLIHQAGGAGSTRPDRAPGPP
jgi:uncharacterized protein